MFFFTNLLFLNFKQWFQVLKLSLFYFMHTAGTIFILMFIYKWIQISVDLGGHTPSATFPSSSYFHACLSFSMVYPSLKQIRLRFQGFWNIHMWLSHFCVMGNIPSGYNANFSFCVYSLVFPTKKHFVQVFSGSLNCLDTDQH